MSPAFVIYNFFTNIFYLFKGHHTKSKKAKILAKYFELTILFPIYKFLNIKKIRFSGISMEAFAYDNIYHLFGEIFVKSVYFFRSPVENPVIIDAGANIGASTLFFKFLYPNSQIYAFEPDPKTFNLLKKNIKNNNFSQIHLGNYAIAQKAGQINFYSDSKPGSESASAFAENNLKTKIKVNSIALSQVIKKINKVNLLKMDIEGYEYLVFQELIDKNCLDRVDEIIVEYHHHFTKSNKTLDQFLALLRSQGYEYQIDGTSMPLYKKNFFQAILIYAFR